MGVPLPGYAAPMRHNDPSSMKRHLPPLKLKQTVKILMRPGSVVVQWLAHLPLMLEVPGLIPAHGEENFWCPNMRSVVSFAGMTLDKCMILRIGELTGCPLCRESHLLCRLKNPTVI